MDDTAALLDALLAPRRAPFADLAAFRAAWRPAAAAWAAPIDRALLGGAMADRLGYAFAAAYEEAVARLVPGAAAAACLCVTETDGAHPRAIHTRLTPDGDGLRLDGAKRWSTLADAREVLWVVASIGWEGDQNQLRLVRVQADAPGVTRTRMPPTPFTPEIPHFALAFDGVRVAPDDVLPGDAWVRYARPFRTIEDTFVVGATAAWVLRVARAHGWPPVIATRLTALILAVRGLGAADPDAASVHLGLAGCRAALDAILAVAEPHWSATDAETAARWHRDAPLLRIAEKAQMARTNAAVAKLLGP